jgi:hypothetical protein
MKTNVQNLRIEVKQRKQITNDKSDDPVGVLRKKIEGIKL